MLSLTKGLDPVSGKRLSTLLEDRPVAALSGPNFAEEIGHGLPAAAVIASEDVELAERLQHELNSLIFRVYVHQDLVGLEIAAASKNVIALAAGGVDGLELGDNAKTAIVTRGPGGDDAARRSVRRPERDLCGPGRDGGSDRDQLVAPRSEPPRRRADRTRFFAG